LETAVSSTVYRILKGVRSQRTQVEALEGEVARLTTMLASAPDFIARVSLDGRILFVNRRLDGPGRGQDEVVGTSLFGYLPPAFRERAREAIDAAISTREVQRYETVAPAAGRRLGRYLIRVSPVLDGCAVTSLVMVATDISDQHESRQLLELALSATELGIWTYDPKRQDGSWDRRTHEIYGRPVHEPPTHTTVVDAIHPDDRILVVAALEQAQRTGRYGPVEHRIVWPDGQVRWVVGVGVADRGEDGEVERIVGSTRDITERRVLEARLIEAEKLEGIGRLAGGIAHDFNNMLTTILGNVEFTLAEVGCDGSTRVMLEEIRSAAERSAELTAQLLAFARRQMIKPEVVSPNLLVSRIEPLLRSMLPPGIQLATALEARAKIKVDPSQLDQVLLSLVTNARDAMPEGGTLTIETADVVLDDSFAEHHPNVRPGLHVLVSVLDTGWGIAPEMLPRVFEPFFTTRPGSTGLGLAMSYGIVRQNDGHIFATSRLREGTTFNVYLPACEGPEPTHVSDEGCAAAAVGGQEAILVVEDEPLVRSIIERTLRGAGYRVYAAEGAERAMQLAEAAGPFHLLVTDVVMPGLGGRELAERLASSHPEMPVLYISGFTDAAIVQSGVVDPRLQFLRKPFLPRELLAAVRRALAVSE